jgi:hypothetical protein
MTQDSANLEKAGLVKASKKDLALTAAGLGMMTGIGIGTIGFSQQANLSRSLALLAVGAGVSTTTTYLVLDYRQTTRRNELQEKINRANRSTAKVQTQLTQTQHLLSVANQEASTARSTVEKTTRDWQSAHRAYQMDLSLHKEARNQESRMVEGLNATVAQLQVEVQRLETEASDRESTRSLELNQEIQLLQNHLIDRQKERDELLQHLEALQEGMAEEITEQVESRSLVLAESIRQREIKQVATEYESLASQLFTLFEQLETWGEKVKWGHESKSDVIRGLAGEYNGVIDQLKKSVSQETSSYLAQIEILNEKLGRAYAVNAGEILEVQKKDFGYSAEGAIANEIAVWVESKLNIPLAVRGLHLKDSGLIEAGYGYSTSANPDAIAETILKARELCARNLGIYKIESVRKLEITDCLSISFRRDRPAARSEKGTLYRSQADFMKLLLSSRLFFRFVGSPGKGKTPTVMVLLSQLLKRGFLYGNVPEGRKLPLTTIDFCNPLEDISVKNTAAETAIFHRWSEPRAAFKDLKAEYLFRRESENKNYRENVGYVWVCDEFDNAIADMKPAELKGFMKLLKDGGHINMGAIVMGQAVMASTSNFRIEDQKFLLNILLDSVAIRTFLEEYGEKFYAPKAIEIALNTLKQIEDEIEETNEFICDTARQLRVAMVVAERSPVFYQLPYFDGIEIDKNQYEEIREKIADVRAGRNGQTASISVSENAETLDLLGDDAETDGTGRSPMSPSGTVGQKPACLHCGSAKIRSKGNKWLCEDPAHSERAPGKPKSWNK